MLEVKNLVKCYSTKGGVTVKALDGVSVKFPETGMVFLLGRSGSGKSTLLNVSGGLDKPDSGEVIVKGRSSSEFSTSDFDSYRNTFIGFIFQEYNILNEFTVEQNIALALQLQSKPNDKEAVNKLLEQVDLKGLGKRKPNTLSGGQKQRVAIARALIKEPEIIMADEPTGALDSNTGKQVFDTLKKLSETKLIIVVSHDRDFAEQYGDRIIELKDGKIISDVSKSLSEVKQLNENVEVVSPDTISIKKAEDITEDDVKSIVKILKKNGGEAIITASKRELPSVKRACRINDSGSKEYFAETTEVKTKEYNGKYTEFIKSKLPASHAIKMGASGLKTKPIRLIFTILLSVVAFIMFGVVSTFMLYDSNYSVAEALKTADYPSMTINKKYNYINQQYKVDNKTGVEELDWENDGTYRTRFGVQELADKNALGQGKFAGIFDFTNEKYEYSSGNTVILSVDSITANVKSELKNYYPVNSIYGFTDCGADYMSANGFTLTGTYPTKSSEIAIPEYVANLFINTEGSGITDFNGIINKKLKISGINAIDSNKEFTITGVYNVGQIPSKYDTLKTDNNQISEKEKETLVDSLKDLLKLSYNTILYVSNDFYDEFKGNMMSNSGIWIQEDYSNGIKFEANEIMEDYQDWWNVNHFTEKTVADYTDNFEFYGFDGQTKQFALNDGEIWISTNMYQQRMMEIYRNAAQRVIEHSKYASATDKADLKEGGEFYEAYNTYDVNKLGVLMAGVSKYYTKLSERQFALEYGEYMKNNSTNPTYQHGSDFSNSLDAARNYVNEVENAEFSEEQWNALVSTVKANLKTVSEMSYYKYFATVMYNKANENVRNELNALFDANNFGIFSQKVNELSWSGMVEDADYQKIKTAVDTRYQDITGKAVGFDATTFALSVNVNIDKIYYKDYLGDSGTLTVVGVFATDSSNTPSYIVSSEFMKAHSLIKEDFNDGFTWKNKEITTYVEPEDAKYNYIITLTNNTQEEIRAALSATGDVVYGITNTVYSELSMFLETITEMQTIFLIIGLVLGVFSALMLLNFISVSISAKKKDIGILRAVGARGTDVFKIFFSEAFIIAIICFLLSAIGAFVVCNVLNTSLVSIVNMKLLDYGVINVLLILAVSFGISVVATFFPVYFAAKKPPVESIRAL